MNVDPRRGNTRHPEPRHQPLASTGASALPVWVPMLTSASEVPVATRVSITDLTREMPLFLLAHFVVLCLLTFIPALSTWLPHTLGFQ